MNKNILFIGVLLMLSATTFHWIMRDNSSSIIKGASTLNSHIPKANTTLQPALKENINHVVSTSLNELKPKEIKQEFPQKLTEQFSLLSQAYVDDISYPSYSIPLLSSNINYLKPNHFSVVNIPVLDGSHTVALSLEKYRFDYPEPIIVTLTSELPIDHIDYELLDPETRKSLTSKYTQELTTEFSPQEDWPQEVRIKAAISFLEGKDTLIADIQFSNPVAYVDSLSPVYSSGDDMILPLNMDIKESGNYRIRANLYQENGDPIASLSNKAKLSQGVGIFELKAHSSVLKGKGDNFELRTITVERMSDFPGEKTRYGASKETVFPISSFDTSSLTDEPYQMSEQEKERLQFLNDIAQQ
ncbi:hypothetical protein [Aliivibrio sifiae]|uniref:Uncharacterized protein n=1 Tax=Aliivibrio sifiae TaxID=566293 RepID=A0A2S7XFH4_9GAMM|nr:hypothetical protein [Aliivibrio sifiae]PQJ89922.1 hypothetical protein BTO22_10150 [Aliivibrio sifiae]